MICVGIHRMVVTMVMSAVVMFPVMVDRDRDAIWLTRSSALQLAERAAFGKPLHMVVMTLLSTSNVLLKPKNLSPIFAKRTIHGGITANDLVNPLSERLYNLEVITQIASGKEFNRGVILGHAFSVLANPTHQHT